MVCGPSLEDAITVSCLFDAKFVGGSEREELAVKPRSLRPFSFLNWFVKDSIVPVLSSEVRFLLLQDHTLL
jgi:hypothetical protein